MNDIATQPLEFAADDRLAGFRLERLELYNWGTFGNQVWTLNLHGRNTLLTGDIGSGKSTLVDAVTALLVPSHRVAFNKAAGAGTRERTLLSYVLGHYKSERSEMSASAKPVALRGHDSFSVILGVFSNAGYEQKATLAQVFWIKESQGQPERFYVAHNDDLSIAAGFADFGNDMSKLRKRLRTNGCEVFDSFPPYGAWYRRRFGIRNEQAMELFHQTVSMKSVGNLTEFVRGHMLEPFDVESRIQALLGHFDDLNRAHEAVLRAKRQVELLAPLAANCDKQDQLAREIGYLRACRDALRPYFAEIKRGLLTVRISELDNDLSRYDSRIARLEEEKRGLQSTERDLYAAMMAQGGDRIARINEEIRAQSEERARREEKSDRYAALLRELELPIVEDPDVFLARRSEISKEREVALERETSLQNEQTEAQVEFRDRQREHEELAQEIVSLESRRNNIDVAQIRIREALCDALGYEADEMPFAGELIQVQDRERDWEGAIERLMRNFGLSLLVPDTRYERVAKWVDDTQLRGRLVYYRVRAGASLGSSLAQEYSAAAKVDLKHDSPFCGWLSREVAQRFGHVCCDTQEQFRREPRAITRAGQTKAPDQRHEKDDRHRIDDRSRYVLGWDNSAKVTALKARKKTIETTIGELGARLAKLQESLQSLRRRLEGLTKLDGFRDYRELDWQSLAMAIARLEDEKKQLEAASDVLQALTAKRNETLEALGVCEENLTQYRDRHSRTAQKKTDAESLLAEAIDIIAQADAEALLSQRDRIDSLKTECLGDKALTVELCGAQEQELRKWVQDRIDAEDKRLARLCEKIVDAMRSFKTEYPIETQEADVAVEAADEYRAMLRRIEADDLPRFQARFKELLNENTIREIANFHSQLARERDRIRERINQINGSLTQIDYNEGRYIRIEASVTQDPAIRDFQGELRQCTEGELTGSEDSQYSEAKFLQVKHIIERFRGREGQTDLDRQWTAKVTDVRNWFVFAASERWREDNTEYEHYSDSGGKSGGQKEKLAYTVLAASLAYQFGLEWGEVRSRTFRFVALDEAFGRGSDDSARYALSLFEKLNLQLLIVTPLQKIHVIEPFVSSVGFVQNKDGNASVLRNLTIEEYHAQKAVQSA